MPETDYMPAIFLNPAVARDMHLSPEVSSKEQSVMMEQGMALLPLFSQGNAHPSAQQKQKMAMQVLAAYRKMEAASLAPLNASQRVRYRQLSLQFYGPIALLQPHVANALGLSQGQRQHLSKMIMATSQGMAKSAGALQGAGPNMMGAVSAITSERSKARVIQEQKVKAILTPAQYAHWSSMQGRKLPGIDNILGGLGG